MSVLTPIDTLYTVDGMPLRNCPDCLEDYDSALDHECPPTGVARKPFDRNGLHTRLATTIAAVYDDGPPTRQDYDMATALVTNVVEDAIQSAYMQGRHDAVVRAHG